MKKAGVAFGALLCGFFLLVLILSSSGGVTSTQPQVQSSGGGADIVQVALSQVGNVGGQPYWSWYGFGSRVEWCACFVSWCANECGYIESGIIPKYAYCPSGEAWFKERNQWKSNNETPSPGDIIFFDFDGDGVTEHTGIVQYAENGNIVTVEGNTGGVSNSAGDCCEIKVRSASMIKGYGTPNYPSIGTAGAPLINGQTIHIPAGLGSVRTYMGWQLITSTTSMQYRLREDAGMNFDSEGFGIIGDRYVIACTTTYGNVGDRVDFYLENGTMQKCIIGDIKNPSDPGCNQWGHLEGACIIEYVVDYDTWYPSHSNPGTAYCHPEWHQNVVKAVNRGSFWSQGGSKPDQSYDSEKEKDPEQLIKDEEEKRKDPEQLIREEEKRKDPGDFLR